MKPKTNYRGGRVLLKSYYLRQKYLKRRLINEQKTHFSTCCICQKLLLNEMGRFIVGTIQTGVNSYCSDNCFRFTKHFCEGEKVYKKICKECQDERK